MTPRSICQPASWSCPLLLLDNIHFVIIYLDTHRIINFYILCLYICSLFCVDNIQKKRKSYYVLPLYSCLSLSVWQVQKARPSDKDAKLKYQECSKIVKMNAFARAIAVESREIDIAQEIEDSLTNMRM